MYSSLVYNFWIAIMRPLHCVTFLHLLVTSRFPQLLLRCGLFSVIIRLWTVRFWDGVSWTVWTTLNLSWSATILDSLLPTT
jgi:hypothetical protein